MELLPAIALVLGMLRRRNHKTGYSRLKSGTLNSRGAWVIFPEVYDATAVLTTDRSDNANGDDMPAVAKSVLSESANMYGVRELCSQ